MEYERELGVSYTHTACAPPSQGGIWLRKSLSNTSLGLRVRLPRLRGGPGDPLSRRGRSSCDLPKLVWKRQLAVPEGAWKVICPTSSAVQGCLPSLSAHYFTRTARSRQPRRHGSHLAACPRRAVGVGGGETRQARAGSGNPMVFLGID